MTFEDTHYPQLCSDRIKWHNIGDIPRVHSRQSHQFASYHSLYQIFDCMDTESKKGEVVRRVGLMGAGGRSNNSNNNNKSLKQQLAAGNRMNKDQFKRKVFEEDDRDLVIPTTTKSERISHHSSSNPKTMTMISNQIQETLIKCHLSLKQ
ncbi:hypothetical protein PPL_07813 [Heterostelium album PN500]|uniref:Uncharacterized protein n=1 Tax=Heterostelium pallidum (strain ATCC 26659 / Pp 5 / PN500) TaxID=670386 RepID=D3BH11_HETP5|nr:hypothetical protein PPL_07813 [Heterostelium album PN500]EFA79395.1 hypothetical protein PPL_07813 [Heterostelium album PN500]|eukprot:XP_020431516.1 hypothetical protein PPL_07813 [Heterostelium album PN500]